MSARVPPVWYPDDTRTVDWRDAVDAAREDDARARRDQADVGARRAEQQSRHPEFYAHVRTLHDDLPIDVAFRLHWRIVRDGVLAVTCVTADQLAEVWPQADVLERDGVLWVRLPYDGRRAA